MFDHVPDSGAPVGVSGAVARVRDMADELALLPGPLSDAGRVGLLRALEELKAAAAAAQARTTVALDASVRAAEAAAGIPAARQGRGVAAQVALARRESPHAGNRHLGLARAMVEEMPSTLAALSAGLISEWRATLLVRETACLTREHRAAVDRQVAGDPVRLERLGDRGLAGAARAAGYRLDPHAATRRARRAAADRSVTLRPAPDTMTYLTALLPVAQGVACFAALSAAADTARSSSEDGRGRGQLMADTLVERLTGRAVADPAPVRLGLVMTDRTLLDGDPEPALLEGHGPIPAPLARDLLRPRPGADDRAAAAVWLHRLYAEPHSGQLIAAESRGRLFPAGLRRLLLWRDQTCRTPWCDAPIRHADHVRPAAEGGPTSLANGQGLCEACNHAKQALGWTARALPDPDGGDASGDTPLVRTTTPSGHRYDSRPPPLPWSRPPPRPDVAISVLEKRLFEYLRGHRVA